MKAEERSVVEALDTLHADLMSNLRLISVHLNKLVISTKRPVNWSLLNQLIPDLNGYLNNLVFILKSTKSHLLKKNWLGIFNDILDNIHGLLSSVIEYSYSDIMNHAEIIHQISLSNLPCSELQALKTSLYSLLDIFKDTQNEISDLDLVESDLSDKGQKILKISHSLPNKFEQLIDSIKDTDNLHQIHTKSTQLSDIWDDVVYNLDDDHSDDFNQSADNLMRVYNDIFSSVQVDLSKLKI
ncbi:hypothetical protein E3P77_01549 [Wallemia ichthyophaga]|nr:hypothetical protein E3P77_01549 [Wallemia ichthyophaga]